MLPKKHGLDTDGTDNIQFLDDKCHESHGSKVCDTDKNGTGVVLSSVDITIVDSKL